MTLSPQAVALAERDRVRAEMEALCAVSSPWGDHPGAERCIELVSGWLPPGGELERIPSSSSACVPDLVVRWRGAGTRRLLLLGHLDTVVAHERHRPVRLEHGRLTGSGTSDMKGGVAISLAVARALAPAPDRFAELSLLLVTDEEWRTEPFRHVPRFSGYDACLCFEAGERTPEGEEAVIVTRKGAGTLRITATGRAAHSGSQPQLGRNALLALSRAALEVAALHAPEGPDRLTVVPTILAAGEALNMVPPHGQLTVDMRSDDTGAFARVLDAVPRELDEVRIEPVLERVWPAMDARAATVALLARAGDAFGAPIIARGRGGASDASHFAPTIPLTVDGLGPRGGKAHNPGEFVSLDALAPRLGVALAVAWAACADGPAGGGSSDQLA
ncbi:MAG TPA: M20/M25/M40 family metallo-hydrolase [Solirubrobacteraceae bacterium]|nr:M20/M25/M40 family metallo-hydrolase [Solirubrobacteraceae bacterium]